MTDDLSPDQLQLAFHEVECHSYDERFGIAVGPAMAQAAAAEVARLLPPGELSRGRGRVADVGCGTGYLGVGLAAAGYVERPVLIDLSPGMLGRAAANAARLDVDADLLRASASSLPLRDDGLDAVVTRGVLHHLHDPIAALREWRRVLRPGGIVIVLSEPTPVADTAGGWTARATLGALAATRRAARAIGRPLSEHDTAQAQEHHYWDLVGMAANLHTFTPAVLRGLATEAGFEDVDVSGAATVSITWAGAYYILAGELPGLAESERAKRLSGRVFAALRRAEGRVLDRVVPERWLLTTHGVLRAP